MSSRRDKMMIFLRDSIWQFISVVVGIVCLLFTAFTFTDVTSRVIGIIIVIILTVAIIAFLGIFLPEQKQSVSSTRSLSASSTGTLPIPITSTRSSHTTTQPPSINRGPITGTARREFKRLLDEGEALYHRGRYKEALRVYQQAEVLNPNEYIIYQKLGDCYYKLKSYPKALNAYDKVDLLNDDLHTLIFYHKAMTLENLNRNKEAMEAYRRGSLAFDQSEYNKNQRRYIRFIQVYYRVKSVLVFFFFFIFGYIFLTPILLNPNTPDDVNHTITLTIALLLSAMFIIALLFVLLSKMILGIKIIHEEGNKKKSK